VTPGDVSIIIPALNEEQSIESVVRELVAAFPAAEIIVVNDGSTDKTDVLAAVIDQESPRGDGGPIVSARSTGSHVSRTRRPFRRAESVTRDRPFREQRCCERRCLE
jgi:glycosyltransferase involved in cell wall biosynthesis